MEKPHNSSRHQTVIITNHQYQVSQLSIYHACLLPLLLLLHTIPCIHMTFLFTTFYSKQAINPILQSILQSRILQNNQGCSY